MDKQELFELGKSFVNKINELQEKKQKIKKEMQSPFLNRTMREKYKKELPEIDSEIEYYKNKIKNLAGK
jgi:FtsZ-binding cell division protein ZapB